MSEWLPYLPQGLIVAGIMALIVEVMVLGLATFFLLFFGVALILTGLVMQFDVISTNATLALWSVTLMTGILALVFWRPLKRIQTSSRQQHVSTEFTDHSFLLEKDVDRQGLSQHTYSGIRWKLKSTHPIPAGTWVKVDKIEVGVMWISPLTDPH
ncbi:activity regulator of membrane protease YbbK [Terasakiispira papahanaumokuakeensis]|uniref:Activity regulator of membrane protease YbbK n=1 Tax=Terasakiispira papahanaumokuakeensis TaxID=197479 RepID=A0A1E2VCB3_9GAMM|nr:activity regulator of membrane protease YbbK [Terasakiispira papahanaumokuakeensis]ODC04621.1 activity regulator of membrane protease YbbK [Terasakiispira papahanaumokuakeensis]